MPKSLPEEAIDVARRLLRSKGEKEQEKEMDRDTQVRIGKARIRRHIEKQKAMMQKLWGIGKRALSLNDDKQFRQIGKQFLWTQDDVARWEKALISFELLEAKRDQAHTSTEFMKSLKALTESIMAPAEPQNIAEMQRDLEQGLARAATLEERMSFMLETMNESLADSAEESDRTRLDSLEKTMTDDLVTDEMTNFDAKIETGLEKIREAMKRN